MCLTDKGLVSSSFNLGEQLVGKKNFRMIDPVGGQAERTAQAWWETPLTKSLATSPGAAPAAPLQGDIALQPIRKVYGGTLLTGG